MTVLRINVPEFVVLQQRWLHLEPPVCARLNISAQK
uniref:Uncharacterized protein n=1 Tax=Rhizophora mucronata TaxID=61149 RepID=A0A2P2KYQ5_RHIMU